MPVSLPDCVFVVTTNQRYQKIAKGDILYVQAEGSWVDIVTADKTYRLSTNLGQVEPQLDANSFSRVSRKHIVNLHHITAIQGGQLFIGEVAVLIGKQYREPLLSQLPILRTKMNRLGRTIHTPIIE
ncbi:LytR/AlgR family response regulator transcription factor [Spirosoma spitsbergense]|jgi:DNA-binding LytR/AlgR family response regulator|uniref:LytR/AlgR family response regulator transcription factor n=1 Tax=Spirosoma spitsbergense TaxID=431554 RepID=UPI000476A85B|nr:LytTR family DNA-binding domain-containing protein [Spirosoma spitsbergense]